MANTGYIGKISALVTASTADLERKLRGATGDVSRFGNSLTSTLSSASSSAQRSLNSIFTPLQRLQRAIEGGSGTGRGRLALVDERQIRVIQQAVSVTEQINKPLARAQQSFGRLTSEVGGAFIPALVRAQEAAIRVNDEIATSGGVTTASFNAASRAVEQTTAALERLSQAQRLIDSGPTGRELEFQSPQVFEALQASAAARRQAAQPGVAARVGGDLGVAVERLVEFDRLVAQSQARVEAARLEFSVDSSELQAAQGQLQDLIAQQRVAREELERLSAGGAAPPGRGFVLQDRRQTQRNLGLFGSQTGTEAERAVQRARELDAEFRKLPESARAGIGSLAGIADRIASEVAATGSGAENLNSILAVLAQRIAAAAAEADEFARISAAADAAAQRITSLAQATESALGGARPTIDSLEKEFRDLLSTLGSTQGVQAGTFEPLTREILELFAAAIDGAENLDELSQKIERLRAQSAGGGLTILEGFDEEAERASRALSDIATARDRIADGLLSAGGGRGAEGLNLGIEESQAQEVEKEILSIQNQLSGFSEDVRGPAIAALQRYREVAARVFRNGEQNTEAGRKAIARARLEVVGLAGDILKLRPEQIGQQLKRTGDIGRNGFGNVSLAVQQAAFAFDDFFSVTGGLDQRIRAAGNNISQLGFVLGGTEGLILGIAASISSQLIVALSRWASGAEVAEARTKALNESLGRQKSAVESLAQAYRSLADEIARAGATERGRRDIKIRQQVDDIRRRSREVTEEDVAAFSPEVARLRGERGILQQRLEGETDLEERLRLQAQIDANRRREEAAVARGIPRPTRESVSQDLVSADEELVQAAEARLRRARLRERLGGNAPPGEDVATLQELLDRRRARLEESRRSGAGATGQEQLEQLRDRRARLEQERAARVRRRESGESISLEPIDAAIDSVTVSIRRLETALAPEVQKLAASFNERALRLADGLSLIAERSVGSGASAIAVAAASVSSRLSSLAEELSNATSPEQAAAIVDQIDALEQQKQSLDSASRSVQSFAAALDRVSGQLLDTVLGEARSAEDQARRDSNRAAAELDANQARGVAPRSEDRFFAARRDRDRRRQGRREIEDLAADADRRNRELVAEFEQQQLQAGNGPDGAGGNIRARDAAQARIDQLERERDEAIRNGDIAGARRRQEEIRIREEQRDEAQRRIDRSFEDSAQGQEARRNANRVDEARQRQEIMDERIRRGRELEQSPAERAGAQLAEDLRSLEAAFRDDPNRNQQEFQADRQRLIDEAFRATAPAIAGLAASVQNAVLSGPSRAALQATDVSTVEGNRELNRLIRGDDSARNQDLVELQRQSEALEELVRIAREEGVPIADN
jgi:hypothetical protein